ncbi:MAG: cytochrome c [Proteobacteria bacterium]|nr:cytochrome c [Pseudomonadota bacterium]
MQSSIRAQGSSSIWDGIYTEAQAVRGEEEYAARCASCHSVDLRGNSNSPSLLGLSFMFIWEGRTLGELFGKVSTEMPTDQPGSLSLQSYAAILAFILKKNEFPAGSSELSTNDAVLNQILITSEGAAN